ncbi:unnamed protein product [Pleuronectes platessa]|uniref:Uncharacterized protein n=1 Tax=Pleuronectes platessa TaxID=8262 RepID=A0A9N7W2B5_PLEPL|nr:unnamed protein product [Pleuronectes platessa]
MKTVCVTLLAVLLLALLLSSQVVLAQNNMTATLEPNTTSSSPVSVNSTSGDKNAAERIGGLALLLPVALGATLLHGWSQ